MDLADSECARCGDTGHCACFHYACCACGSKTHSADRCEQEPHPPFDPAVEHHENPPCRICAAGKPA